MTTIERLQQQMDEYTFGDVLGLGEWPEAHIRLRTPVGRALLDVAKAAAKEDRLWGAGAALHEALAALERAVA